MKLATRKWCQKRWPDIAGRSQLSIHRLNDMYSIRFTWHGTTGWVDPVLERDGKAIMFGVTKRQLKDVCKAYGVPIRKRKQES